MCEFAYMKLYPADLLGDTEDLTAADFGSYMLMLISMWRQGGRLRLEPGGLSRIARRSSRHWPEVWGRLIRFFRVSEDGLWISQKRLNAELDDARERREQASKAAKARHAARSESCKTTSPDLGKTPRSDPGKTPRSTEAKSLESNNPNCKGAGAIARSRDSHSQDSIENPSQGFLIEPGAGARAHERRASHADRPPQPAEEMPPPKTEAERGAHVQAMIAKLWGRPLNDRNPDITPRGGEMEPADRDNRDAERGHLSERSAGEDQRYSLAAA